MEPAPESKPAEEPKPNWFKKHQKILITVGSIVAALLLALGTYLIFFKEKPKKTETTEAPAPVAPLYEPKLTSEELVSGHDHIWDIAVVSSNTLLYDERNGNLHIVDLDSKEKSKIGTVPNVLAEGEGGLMGLARDTNFATNRYVYACYNAQGSTRSVRVTRFKLDPGNKSVSDFTDIISDIQSKAGRHSGCRMVMDADEVLWIGTGDSAIGSAPQDPKSLAGKVLRVDRDGKGVAGNLGDPFDNRIYSYGHRNIQGISLFVEPFANGAVGLTAEHGSGVDDEVNWLLPGNFGWNPNGKNGVYDESVPMTDKTKYPDALEAVWSSGDPTIATSGVTILNSLHWSQWRGWAAMAVLKDKQVRLLNITDQGLQSEKVLFEGEFGRIRAVIEGPEGYLYLSTDNGDNDKIIRVIPGR